MSGMEFVEPIGSIGAQGRDSQVGEQAERLEKAVGLLLEDLNSLEARLEIVLRKRGVAGAAEKPKEGKEGLVPLASRMRQLRRGVEDAVDRIRSLIERLEV